MQVDTVTITTELGSLRARLDHARAPRTVAAFLALLPLKGQLLHARWSGEGIWIPLPDEIFELPAENITSEPLPGQVLLYPGPPGEAEIFIAYGRCRFQQETQALDAHLFMEVTDGLPILKRLGDQTLWQGAQPVQVRSQGRRGSQMASTI